jgi:hypothetical protein
MERYIVYDINTSEMIGMIDPEVTSREDHLTRCGESNSITTNTITLSSDSDIVYPFMITVVDGVATYDPNAEPESEPEAQWATFAE